MRIWSLHPKYLDSKGLIALWRETLLAKHVLYGLTKGYLNHPQLDRFKKSANPKESINQYLASIYEEARLRNYNFDKEKIDWKFTNSSMNVTNGQIAYEKIHLLKKLSLRDTLRHEELLKISHPMAHPIFKVVDGEIENWEIIT